MQLLHRVWERPALVGAVGERLLRVAQQPRVVVLVVVARVQVRGAPVGHGLVPVAVAGARAVVAVRVLERVRELVRDSPAVRRAVGGVEDHVRGRSGAAGRIGEGESASAGQAEHVDVHLGVDAVEALLLPSGSGSRPKTATRRGHMWFSISATRLRARGPTRSSSPFSHQTRTWPPASRASASCGRRAGCCRRPAARRAPRSARRTRCRGPRPSCPGRRRDEERAQLSLLRGGQARPFGDDLAHDRVLGLGVVAGICRGEPPVTEGGEHAVDEALLRGEPSSGDRRRHELARADRRLRHAQPAPRGAAVLALASSTRR